MKKLLGLVALCALCILGCKTPPAPPGVQEFILVDGKAEGHYEVYEGRIERGEAVAYVEKTSDAPGYYPIVLFRCLDGEGLTIQVVSGEKKNFAYEKSGVKHKIVSALPQGTSRVEVTLTIDGGPNPGAPK